MVVVDVVVVDTPDALLVADRSHAQDVKALVDRLLEREQRRCFEFVLEMDVAERIGIVLLRQLRMTAAEIAEREALVGDVLANRLEDRPQPLTLVWP